MGYMRREFTLGGALPLEAIAAQLEAHPASLGLRAAEASTPTLPRAWIPQ